MCPAEAVTDEVVIGRPVRDVYGFYRDFANVPRIVGDIVTVANVGDRTYRWVVRGPFGVRLPMTVTITEERLDRLLRYETRGPVLVRARWQLEFGADEAGRGTRVRERLEIPLGSLGRGVLALIGKRPEREVAANLRRLKQLLESPPGPANGSAVATTAFVRPSAPTDGKRGTP